MLPGGMQVSLIAVPASTGAFIPVRATITSRRVEFVEDIADNSAAGQGLQYYFVDPQTVPNNNAPTTSPADAPASWYTFQPGEEPIILGDLNSLRSGYGPAVGNGPQDAPGAGQPASLGTIYLYMRSNGNATNVRMSEFI